MPDIRTVLARAGQRVLGPLYKRLTAMGRISTREKARANHGGIAGKMWFMPYGDGMTGETATMRSAYRIMWKDPVVKAALLSKFYSVASLDLKVKSPVPGRYHQRAAEFVRYAILKSRNGLRGIAEAVIPPGLTEGHSLAEKVFTYINRGEWSGKIGLEALKSKDPEHFRYEIDEFKNVTGIVGLRFDSGTVFHPSLFVRWQHLPMYEHPFGMSDLRAAYRAWWMLDTVWKLRAIHLEKYTSPMLEGTYTDDGGDNTDKALLEDILEKAKSSTWYVIPDSLKVEAKQVSVKGTSDYESAIRDLKQDLAVGVNGAFLQMVEGTSTGARATGEVHQSQSEGGNWYLKACLSNILQDQIAPDLTDLNHAGAEYPDVSVGGVNEADMKAALDVDERLQRMGWKLSKKAIGEKYDRQEAEGPDDELKPPEAAGGGGFGGGPIPFVDLDPPDPKAEPTLPGPGAGWDELDPADVLEFCGGPGSGKPGPCPDGTDRVAGLQKQVHAAYVAHLKKPTPATQAALDQASAELRTAKGQASSTPSPKAAKPKPEARPKAQAAGAASPAAPARSFEQKRDISKWSTEHYAAWESSLAPQEKKAFTKYVGPEYTQFNGWLRNHASDVASAAGERGAAVRTLDAALSRAKVPERVTAFRGMATDPGLKPGATFQDKGFVSTSLHKTSAENFAGAGGGVLMEIKVPKGASGAMVDRLSGFDESELLLPRQSKFKVTGKQQDGGRTVYQVELLHA